MEFPDRSGVALAGGADAITEATTPELLAWLRTQRVPEARLREVEQLDRGLTGFRQAVLRYGLVKALLGKGYDVPHDAAAWAAFEAAMQEKLRTP